MNLRIIMKKLLLFITIITLFTNCLQNTDDNNENAYIINEAVLTDTTGDWRDQIIYFIVTDRFKDGDISNNETRFKDNNPSTPLHDKTLMNRFHGGDLKGVVDNLGYIKDLGITSLWITPVVYNVREDNGGTGYHGYWAWDMTRMDPHLISVENSDDKADGIYYYRDFVKTMHNNNILVIQDIVLNHMGNLFLYNINNTETWGPVFKSEGYGESSLLWIDDSSNKGSEWIEIGLRMKPPTPFNNPAFYNICGNLGSTDQSILLGDLSGLDDLKTSSAEVRNVLKKVYTDWIKYTDIDGFRIDTVKHIEPDFFEDFSLSIRNFVDSKNPSKKFIQFGESYVSSHSAMQTYTQGNKLDSMLNFELYYVMNSVFKNYTTNGVSYATNKLTTELNNRSVLRQEKYLNGGAEISASEGTINFIDNHDVDRYLYSSGHNTTTLKQALGYLLTTKGIPCIYYGTEKGLKNSVSGGDNGRLDMPNFDTTGDIYNYMKELIKIRTDNISLRRGNISVLKDSTMAGIFSFVRYTENSDENIYVFINTSIGQLSNEVINDNTSSYFEPNLELIEIFPNDTEILTISQEDAVSVNIPANSMKIYKKKI